MAKYIVEESTLKGLADALRKVTGEDRTYTPTEMIDAVSTILETGVYILVDENGVEIPAVFVDNETTFTATANDIRIGTTAVTEAGVTEGTKEIPSYYTTEGYKLIPNNSEFTVTIPDYAYTKLQAIFCPFNTSIAKSVVSEKVAIEGKVYAVQSSTVESTITIDDELQAIKFGFTNISGSPYLVRYFTYKEVY